MRQSESWEENITKKQDNTTINLPDANVRHHCNRLLSHAVPRAHATGHGGDDSDWVGVEGVRYGIVEVWSGGRVEQADRQGSSAMVRPFGPFEQSWP